MTLRNAFADLATEATLGEINVKTPALVSGSTPVTLPAGQLATLTPPAAITGFALEATQSSVLAKLNSSVAVTGTFYQATQPVSFTWSGLTDAQLRASPLPLPTGAATSAAQASILAALGSPLQDGGTVAVSNFPATQNIAALSLPLPVGAATASGVAAVVTALGSPLQAGGSVSVSNLPATQPVRSAFGDVLSSELQPKVNIKATYGILDECQTFSATGGSATAADSEFLCQTGTSVGGYGVIWSRRPIIYVPGVGAEARITARFTSPVALSLQLAGLFTSIDGMFFGYNGTSFGVMHRHHGAIEIRTLTVTVGSGGAATATVTLNGVAYTAAITAGTAAQNAHEIELGLNAGAAANIWHIYHVDSSVVFVSKDAGAKAGAYSVSVSAGTLAGSIAVNTAGVAPTEDWTPQASWNVDTCSWLDKTKGNLFKLEFAYLGYGPLKFSVLNPTSGVFETCHVVHWENANIRTNLSNPSMRVGWVAASMGSSGTNLTVAGASAMAGLQGAAERVTAFGAYGVAASVTTATQVLSVYVRREFGGRAMNGLVLPKILSISTDSTRGAVFRLLKNATVAGTTTHTYVDEVESGCTYDTGGTTVTGGRLMGVYSVGPSGRATIELSALNNVLVAGDELVVTAQVTSGAAAEMTASMTWEETI